MQKKPWARLLTDLINQELLLKNAYVAAENRILRAHLLDRLRLSDPERSTLAGIGKLLGRKALAQVACVAKPDTILAWYRKLIAEKFDGSKYRRYPGRPPIEPQWEELIVKMARENSAGATTELWADWPISDTLYPTRLWGTSRSGMASRRHRKGAKHDVEGIHPMESGRVGRDRLLYGGGPYLARDDHLLRLVLHSSG